MKLYQANEYINRKGLEARNLFLILSDEERTHLATVIDQLETDVLAKRKAKQLKRWTKYDTQAVTFLKRICHYGAYPEAEMIDFTVDQVMTLIHKMLFKVYGNELGQFHILTGFRLSNTTMSRREMRSFMERKRMLKAKHTQYLVIPPTTPSDCYGLEF